MLLSAELLLYYQRCHRRAFLDVYGDATAQDPESEFLLKLQQDSRTHRATVMELQGLDYQQPDYDDGNWHAGAQATLELMERGVECIYKGVLFVEVEDDIAIVCIPDLLVKQSGSSRFGDWLYVPTNIKLGKRPKLEYQIVTALDAIALKQIQGIQPPSAWLHLRERRPYRVNLDKCVPQMQRILDDCLDMLRRQQEPEVFISRQRCSLCHWLGSCHAIAQSQQHLSLLPGITPSRYERLKAANFGTLEAIAHASLERLDPLVGPEIADRLVRQAQATLQNRAFLNPPPRHATLPFPPDDWRSRDLPTAPVELYFDIEAEPEMSLDYLLGVLVVDRVRNTEQFYPFLAETPAEEGQIWQQFLDLVWAYPQAPIFHFCDYEVQTLIRLAKQYKTPRDRWKPILERFVDVHQWVKDTVVLPVESYALKPIARWLGFEWRGNSANGAQCICWYNQWLETGDRAYLDTIVRYNEDDCRATYVAKAWLADFLDEAIGAHSKIQQS